jgi:hypothetical protein
MQQSGEFREGKDTESAAATVPPLHGFTRARHASQVPCGEDKEQL